MTIKHIVLSGGGYNGLYMLGCINKLLEKEFIDISNVKTIYGTSFGALCGFMLCLKMDWKDIIEYFIERPWEKDIDIKLDLLIVMPSFSYFCINASIIISSLFVDDTNEVQTTPLKVNLTFAYNMYCISGSGSKIPVSQSGLIYPSY